MSRLPKPLADVFEDLRFLLVEAPALGGVDLLAASCLDCGRRVWVLQSSTPPLLMDAERTPTEVSLGVHGCVFLHAEGEQLLGDGRGDGPRARDPWDDFEPRGL